MSVGQTSAAETAIQAGRQHYTAKRYKPALEQFTRAMKLCPCARGMKRDRCSCKDFEQVASHDGSIFDEAMYKCQCPVGKTFNKCEHSLHVQALDYRAATFEALQELDRARRDAEWMLELAPRRLDGYLRLGKIARLQKKPEYAWKIYGAGIEVGDNNGETKTSKMQQLLAARAPLQNRYARKDPMQLPLDIVLMIFRYVDFNTLVRCLRISKVWRRSLTSRETMSLWRTLSFTDSLKQNHAPTAACLKKLLANSGNDARQIIIKDGIRFRMTQSRFNLLLYGSRHLESLELRDALEEIWTPQHVKLKNLRSLALGGFTSQYRPDANPSLRGSPFPHSLIQNAAETLCHLDISRYPSYTTVDLPQMNCLRSLRLLQASLSDTVLPIFTLSIKFPVLERIWLSNVVLSDRHPEDSSWKLIYPRLHTLVVSYEGPVREQDLWAIRSLLSGVFAPRLRNVDMSFPIRYGTLFSTNFPTNPPEHRQPDEYKNLESLRLIENPMDPDEIKRVVEGAVKSGTMHTLDICFPLEHYGEVPGPTSLAHLAKYEWLRGASSIRSMGIFDFRFREFPRNDDDLPLPGFLASFPNLETLQVITANYDERELCSVLKAIIEATHLKTLFQSQVRGFYLDELRALAKSHGVRLVWGTRPREWPNDIEV